MNITISPRVPFYILLTIILIIMVFHALSLGTYYANGEDSTTFTVLFDVGIEQNVPTHFSALQLALAGLVAAVVARQSWEEGDRLHGYWAGLFVLFTFLSFDESCEIHELFSDYMEHWVTPTGYLYYLWVLPYGAAVMVIGAVYLRFLIRLPRATRRRLLLAAWIFLSGAIGVEMVGAAEREASGEYSLRFCILYSAEEFMEMLGVALFIDALVCHLSGAQRALSVTLTPEPAVVASKTPEQLP